MGMPTYYLWKNAALSERNIEEAKTYLKALGFRVVIFRDGDESKDINDGIKEVIKNHPFKGPDR